MVFHETSSQTYGKRMWLPSFQSSFSFDDNFWHYFTYYFGVISCKLIHFTSSKTHLKACYYFLAYSTEAVALYIRLLYRLYRL